jgi:hypothetical protein
MICDNLIKGDVFPVFNFSFLSVSWWLLEGFDDQGRGRRQTSVWACLFWVVSFTASSDPSNHRLPWRCHHQLFWRQTQGTDLRGQGRCDAHLATSALQVHDFDLVGVEFWRHGGGGWCQMNLDSGRPKKVAPLLLPSQKTKARTNFWFTSFPCNLIIFLFHWHLLLPLLIPSCYCFLFIDSSFTSFLM